MTTQQENPRENLPRRNKWCAEDLSELTKIVTQIKFGSMSLRGAAKRFNVTKYEVEKWTAMLTMISDDGTCRVVNDQIKSQVIKAVYYKGMTQTEASVTFKVNKSLIRLWIAQMESPSKKIRAAVVKEVKSCVSDEEKKVIVSQIQAGDMTKSQVVLRYQVSRYDVNTWVSNYSVFNLERTLQNPVYYSMTTEEQNEELKAKIRQLQKELDYARLKVSGLETLVEVAEKKFNIQIKKKSGRKQSPK